MKLKNQMIAALAGVRILDLTRLLPGPFCTMLLADFGADVIKVEEPHRGDYIREWQPRIGQNSGFHVVLNRNKRSLTLNLKAPEGKEIFRQLARQADVVLEGFRPGVMARLGLGYESLRALNPRLIFAALSGYGNHGPRAQRAGHDINYLALSGILSYSGRDGRATLPGVQIADLGGGALLAAFSLVMALLVRERQGAGQYLDISMLDGSFMWNCLRWGKYLADGQIPRPGDDVLNHGFACYNLYATKDGRYMSLGALEPQFWRAFSKAVAHPEWDRANYLEPGPHQEPLKEAVAALFGERTQARSGWRTSRRTIAAVNRCCTLKKRSRTPRSRPGKWWWTWCMKVGGPTANRALLRNFPKPRERCATTPPNWGSTPRRFSRSWDMDLSKSANSVSKA